MNSPAPPMSMSAIQLRKHWSWQEHWVWGKLDRGEVADLNQGEKFGGKVPLDDLERWSDARILSPGFLRTILFLQPFRGRLPMEGVRIRGAWFKDPLDLSFTTLQCQLWLEACRFEAFVNLRYFGTPESLSFDQSYFADELKLADIRIGKQLSMGDHAVFGKPVDLGYAQIGGGLTMRGCTFKAKLDVRGMKVNGTLNMEPLSSTESSYQKGKRCEFADLDLTEAKVDGKLTMAGASVTGLLVMDHMEVAGSVYMNVGRMETESEQITEVRGCFGNISMNGAKIKGNLDMAGFQVNGEVSMNHMEVGGSINMTPHGEKFPCELCKVDIFGSKIGGTMYLDGARILGRLDMNSTQVGDSLLMRKGKFSEVRLGNTRFRGSVELERSTFYGEVTLYSAKIEGNFKFTGLQFEKDSSHLCEFSQEDFVNLKDFMNQLKEGQLPILSCLKEKILSDSQLTEEEFTEKALEELNRAFRKGGVYRAAIKQSLKEAYPIAIQARRGRLSFRGLEVTTFEGFSENKRPETQTNWPEVLDLHGFTYQRLEPEFFQRENLPKTSSWEKCLAQVFLVLACFKVIPQLPSNEESSKESAEWLAALLKKHKNFTPQPYHYLADILRRQGRKDAAGRILYALKERERKEKATGGYRMLLLLSSWLIGHGTKYWRSLIWTVGMTVMGAGVLLCAKGSGNIPDYGLVYSLDSLLPIITLDASHEMPPLVGWVKVYFLFHAAFGWLLGSFLLAGLSGFTQR